MAASVRYDDEAFSDVRFAVLATACHLADADHALGKMGRLWRQCTALGVYILPESTVTAVLGPNGCDALVESELGERVQGGMRMRGTKGRIEWLKKLRRNAKKGGKARAAKRQTQGKQLPAKTSPPPSPPIPVPSSAPSPVPVQTEEPEEDSEPPAAVGSGAVSSKRGKAKRTFTDEQRAVAAVVLGKLGERNGVSYTVCDEHVRLISARVDAGVSELDLRKVIAYCAASSGLGWADKPEMAKYLRPETLFGPSTIARYLDPARTWYEKVAS